jgi:hypothetical protein
MANEPLSSLFNDIRFIGGAHHFRYNKKKQNSQLCLTSFGAIFATFHLHTTKI